MSKGRIACLAVSLLISFVVVFALAGGLAPAWAGSTIGQMLLAGLAALIGIVAGQYIHQRFFPAS